MDRIGCVLWAAVCSGIGYCLFGASAKQSLGVFLVSLFVWCALLAWAETVLGKK